MKKLDKMACILNDEFRGRLAGAMSEMFGIELETGVQLLSGNIVTQRVDGEPFTEEQRAYLKAYEDGYLAALRRVRAEARSR